MKKCVRCDIVFQDDRRIYCLYCDAKLLPLELEKVFTQDDGASVFEKFLKEVDVKNRESVQNLVGNFFRKKSLSFLYAMDRNQFKMGKGFKRLLVQPLDFAYLMKMPWVAVDIIDSLVLRLTYRGFCPTCQWKCPSALGQAIHPHSVCEYNREYAALLDEILSGRIVKTEDKYKTAGEQKIRDGKKSAYKELCSPKRDFEVFLDVAVVLISISAFLSVLGWLMFPFIIKIFEYGEFTF